MHGHPDFWANAVAWVLWAVWLIKKTMLDCVLWTGCSPPVRATLAWHPVEHSRRKQPCQGAGTRLNARARF